jgi:hypothetical protein
MDTRAHAAWAARAHAAREQAARQDGRTASPVGLEQRPGLRDVAARWPQLSPGQARQLYDLVYRRVPEHLRPPVPPARRDQVPQSAPWSRVACGFPLLWAVQAEQRFARRSAVRTGTAAQAA